MDKHAALLSKGSKKPKFFYGYVVIAAGFFVMAVLNAGLHSFGVFLKPISTEFGWTRAATSGAHSMSLFLMGLLYMVTGRLSDRFGPRVVLTVCGVLFGLGYLLMSQISALWQLYLFYGVLVAMGISGGFVPLVSMAVRWFVRRRALMTGIIASGIGAGTMIGPPLAGWLISNYGWRNSYFMIGITTLVLLVLVKWLLWCILCPMPPTWEFQSSLRLTY